MAFDPNSTNNVTVRRFYSVMSSLWAKIKAAIPLASSTTPSMDGTADAGSETTWARGDHVHPTDTSRAPTSHASSSTTYGIGTTNNYGHVKLATGDMNGATNVDGVAVSKNHTHSQYVPTTRKVNGQALSADVTIATPGTLKTNATTAQTASSGEAMSGTITLHKVSKTGTYSDLIGKPTIPGGSSMTPLMDGTAAVGTETSWAHGDHVHPTDTSREAASNKKTSINVSSNTDFPTSKAVADFVNSSIATATAEFLGTYDVVADLGLTTSATNAQISTALGTHTWPSGVTPTNQDYVFVSVDDPGTTTDSAEYRRFKYNGTAWVYEYTLNNSSFTQAQWDAINSGVTATFVQNAVTGVKGGNESTYRTGQVNITKANIGLGNVANTQITVSATAGVKDVTNNVTYKYTHPTFTAVSAAAKKVGMNSEGHVVLGAALAKGDVGLGNVVNTGDSATPAEGGTDKFTTGGAFTELAKKADKVSNATSGHLAGLDANGNLTDSGKAVSDLADVHHGHGNILEDGSILSNGASQAALSNGCSLVYTDQTNKIKKTTITFDAISDHKALTQKGTFETFTNVEPSSTNGKIKIDGNDTTVYTHPAHTAYTSKGSATKVPQITTDALGHVTSISEVTISGVTPASHSHGNISNTGTLTDTAAAAAGNDYVVIRDADNAKIQTSTIKGTDVADAVSKKHSHSTLTLSTTAQAYDGSHTLALPSTDPYTSARTPASHTHGNIQNGGTLQTSDVTIANGDKLVVTDASDSNKVARTSISFDGSTTTKALTQKGTFESFAKSGDITTAIQALDVSSVGGAGKYISAISETDGKISATATTMDTTPTESSTNAVTSGGIKTALDAKAAKQIRLTFTLPTAPSGGTSVKYVKITGTGSGYRQWLCSYNGNVGSRHSAWLFRSYATGESGRDSVTLLTNGSTSNCPWYCSAANTWYVKFTNTETTSSCQIVFNVTAIDISTLPTLEAVNTMPDTATEITVYGVPKAEQLRTARQLAVSLSNTTTNTTFDGSANVTNIKTTGTLGIANGGTGATTKKAAEFAICGNMAQATAAMADNFQFVFSRVGTDQNATNGVFIYRTASTIWDYMKGKIKADSHCLDSDDAIDIWNSI